MDATPITMPSMVRMLRNGLRRKACNAIWKPWKHRHGADPPFRQTSEQRFVSDERAVMQADRTPALGRDAGIMRDHHDGLAGPVERGEQGQDLGAGTAVERAGRLVGEHDQRGGDQGACDRDALLLAARELPREVVGPVHHADGLQARSARARRSLRLMPQ